MLAALAASLIATFYWMWIDDIALARAFDSPVPYATAFLALFIGLPVFIGLRNWLQPSLLRSLVLAGLAISPAALFGWNYFLYPRSAFVVFLLFSTAWVGTASFWLMVRKIRF